MDPSRYEVEIGRQDLVNWCIEDREELKKEFFVMRPQHEGKPPALWIEELLGVLGYRVCFLPMEQEQLGLCDFGGRSISINSELDVFERRCTMAHELGHSRLHEREMAEWVTDDCDYELMRRRQRENEADLYAAIFLVSREELLKQEVVLDLLESRRLEQNLDPEELSSAVWGLAKEFAVSPSFMRNCLLQLNWLEEAPSDFGDYNTELRLKWRVVYDDGGGVA